MTSPQVPGSPANGPADRSLDGGKWADPKAVEEHARRNGRFYETRAEDLAGAAAKPRATPSVTPPVFDQNFYNECRSGIQANNPFGWEKDHYHWCRTGVIEWRRTRTGVLELRMPVTLMALTNNGSRDVWTFIKFESVEYLPGSTFTPLHNFQWGSGCAGSTPTTTCTRQSGSGFFHHLGDLPGIVDSDILTTDGTSSTEVDQKTQHALEWDGIIFQPGSLSLAVAFGKTDPAIPFRCDTAGSYMNNIAMACIFTDVIPFIEFSISDPGVDESAAHYWAALNDPGNTSPIDPNKVIPGRYPDGDLLHRLFYPRTIDLPTGGQIIQTKELNNRVARQTCDAWFPNYNANGGFACDEFPFASTQEGAAEGSGAFSVKPIDFNDNSRSGSALGAWYARDRILDGDYFAVNIVP
jgi:hypothetical protein